MCLGTLGACQKVVKKELRHHTILEQMLCIPVFARGPAGVRPCAQTNFLALSRGVWRALGASEGHKMEQSGVSSGVKCDEK